MHRMRFVLPLTALAGLLLGAACREMAGPAGRDADLLPAFDVTLAPIFNAQLRGFTPPDPFLPASAAWGHAQLSLITTPPDPILPAACVQVEPSAVAGMTAAALCGQIQNPAGQTFVSGFLFTGSVSEPSAMLGLGTFPTDFVSSDCPLLDIAASLLIPDAFAASLRGDPGAFAIAFRSAEFPVASVIGGLGNGPAGPVQANGGASGVKRPKGSPCRLTLNPY